MVRLELAFFIDYKINLTNLHSTMVRLELPLNIILYHQNLDLHSTMVRLELEQAYKYLDRRFLFTFHYG